MVAGLAVTPHTPSAINRDSSPSVIIRRLKSSSQQLWPYAASFLRALPVALVCADRVSGICNLPSRIGGTARWRPRFFHLSSRIRCVVVGSDHRADRLALGYLPVSSSAFSIIGCALHVPHSG